MEHNIFLSHSGEQKGFARDLCNRLRSQGHRFFDENPDSLPPGEQFPPLIFSAVDNCKLALIVLSNDFLSSRWPMMELCAAFDRLSKNRSDPSFTILPLFFKLSPADIKENSNVTKWRKKWMEFEQISHGRITASKCEEVVTKTLPCLNGVVRGAESVQGESSYIEEIVNRISSILVPHNPLRLRYKVDPHKHYVGRERLCKVIEHEFRELENKSSSKIIFLGMHGVPGSGKSTICDFMRDYLRGFMAIHLTLPTDLSAKDGPEVKEQYFKLMSVLFPFRKRDFEGMNLEQLYNQLHLGATSKHKMFLVLDNISPSNVAIYKVMIKAILSSNVLGHGSRVKVVAQSSAILETLLRECEHNHSISYSIIEVPSLTKEEAEELVRNQYSSIKDDLVTDLLKKCTFSIFIPFVFEQIGILLRERRCNDFKEKELGQFWKIVEKGKKDAVKTLVDMNFNQLPQDLKDLFFDIALLIIPAGHSKLTDAIPILRRIHNITDDFDIKCKIEDLRKHCTLSVVWGQLRMHDIFKEYARSNPGISEIYVNQPSLNISNLLVDNDQYLHPRRIDLKFPVARAICIGTCERSIDCQRNDEEVCLHVEVGCTARALLVRNRSEYSRCILVLSGDLSSLVCLQTKNVQQVAFRSSTLGEGDVNLSNLVRLELNNELKLRAEDIMKEENSGSKISSFLDKSREWISWLWKPMESYLPRRYEQRMSNFVFSTRQMTCLRVLRLIDVDIGRIEIVGSPVLEEIEIKKDVQYPMDVSIHRTSKLKRLVIQGSNYRDGGFRPRPLIQGNARKLELGLSDCLELEEVILDRSFHGVKVVGLLPKKLRDLRIADDGRGNKEWIGSSIHQLSALEYLDLSWGSLRINRLSFTQKSFGCLRALKTLKLEQCESLTHLTLEPSCLPNLIELIVSYCEKLQVLEGLEHIIWMGQMRTLQLWKLPQLQVECDLSRWNNCSLCEGSWDSPHLEEIHIRDCPNVKIYFDGLEALEGNKMRRSRWHKYGTEEGEEAVRWREALERWLRDSELGSPLFEAAVEALLWEHMVKGIPGALDALHHYFSSLVDTITSSHAADDLHEYLYYLFYEPEESLLDVLCNREWIKNKEAELFQEWMLQKFPQLSSHIRNSRELERRWRRMMLGTIYDDEGEDDGEDDDEVRTI